MYRQCNSNNECESWKATDASFHASADAKSLSVVGASFNYTFSFIGLDDGLKVYSDQNGSRWLIDISSNNILTLFSLVSNSAIQLKLAD
jgi:hypothetical protein